MHLSITCLHAAAGMLVKLQIYLWLKSHQRMSANHTTSSAEEVWHSANIKREDEFYICSIDSQFVRRYIFIAVWDRTWLSPGGESECQSHRLLLHPTPCCREQWLWHSMGRAPLRKADNLLAVLPVNVPNNTVWFPCSSAYRRASPIYHSPCGSILLGSSSRHTPCSNLVHHFKTWNVISVLWVGWNSARGIRDALMSVHYIWSVSQH